MAWAIHTEGNRITVRHSIVVNEVVFIACVEASISDDLDATAVGAIISALCGNAARDVVTKARRHGVSKKRASPLGVEPQ